MNRDNEQRQSGRPNRDQEFFNRRKDPDGWTTGNEPMTGAQHSYLKTLSNEAGEQFNSGLTKAEASKRIEELQQKTGRGPEQADKETESHRRKKNEDLGLKGGKSSL